MVKKIISVLMISALPMGFAGTALSAQDASAVKAEEVTEQAKVEKCTVTKIEGAKVDLQNEKNEQIAMNIKDEKTLKDLNVGDTVLVKNGKVTKEEAE